MQAAATTVSKFEKDALNNSFEAIFDSGYQIAYISEFLCKILKLMSYRKRDLHKAFDKKLFKLLMLT